jgi:8-amino-7-oxononanoate synthase
LQSRPDAAALLATDGVFSMDGDIAPLRDLATLCKSEHATLMVDDAHGLGVHGAEGSGSVSAAKLSADDVPVVMATLGKAIGVCGAFVSGSATLIDGLIQFARTHMFTTAPPPALAAAASTAIDIARFEAWRREKLLTLIAHFRHGAHRRAIPLLESTTPIQPVVVGSSADALVLSRRLEATGFFVPAIRPPTVPNGEARLRVTLSAAHSESDVERLLDAMKQACVARLTSADPRDELPDRTSSHTNEKRRLRSGLRGR